MGYVPEWHTEQYYENLRDNQIEAHQQISHDDCDDEDCKIHHADCGSDCEVKHAWCREGPSEACEDCHGSAIDRAMDAHELQMEIQNDRNS